MADVVNPQVVDDLTITNIKSIAGQSASLANMFLGHQVSHSKRLDLIAELGVGEMLGQRAGMDVGEAAGTTAVQGGMDVLVAALAQMLVKAGQTTPPVTP